MRADLFLISLLLPGIVLGPSNRLEAQDKIALKVDDYVITSPEYATTRSYNEFQKLNPYIRLEPFSALRLVSGGLSGVDSTKLLSFAADMGPEVVHISIGNLTGYIQNRFIMDLSEFIGRDQDGDGYISDEETIWEPWKSIPAVFRHAVTLDGKPFAVPIEESFQGLVYRKDLLDEIFSRSRLKHPPRTWDELFYLCQKATQPQIEIKGARYKRGRRGIHLSLTPDPDLWGALTWSAGGNLMEAGKQSPTTGQWHWFPAEQRFFVVRETGEDLSRQPTRWRASFASEAGQAAIAFYRRLNYAPWILDPQVDAETGDYEPIDLTSENVQRGAVILADGREVKFQESDIRWGVARGLGPGDDVDFMDALANGEVVFTYGPPAYLFRQAFLRAGISPQHLGFCPVPAGPFPIGRPVFASSRSFYGLNYQLQEAPQKRIAAFKVLAWLFQEMPRNQVRQWVEEGHAAIVPPDLLARAGYSEYIDLVPSHLADAYQEVERFERAGPFQATWQAVRQELIGGVLSRLEAAKDYNVRRGLQTAEEQANHTVISGRSAAMTPTGRGLARVLMALLALSTAGLLAVGIRTIHAGYLRSAQTGRQTAFTRTQGVSAKLVPWLMLGPALGLIVLWAYYPMIKGSLISFQDYSIAGQSRWIGLENFFNVLLDPRLYRFTLITCKFAFWSLLLGFSSPILLALLLSEVPRFKFGFRMIFLLPNVCASLVIVFLWKMLFYPTEAGFLNTLLLHGKLISEPLRFYQDPNWALFCCILPGVWASAGIGSLIYLAALKSVPDELYEAAKMDGANVGRCVWHITLPTIKPLVIIQFVGAFIGTFHTMGDIFVMTGGGPDGQTTVLALKIWKDAFVYLNFGMATATAWVLGSALIGFTIWQLRFLRKVEFRRADMN